MSEKIVETIRREEDNEALIGIARKICEIIFDVRKKKLLSKPDDDQSLPGEDKQRQKLKGLMQDFRTKLEPITADVSAMNDDELYNQVIQPLITQLIDQST